REVLVSGRVKTENESIHYNVDKLHSAMAGNSEITFLYLDWTVDRKLVPRHDGKRYRVSPWALTVKDDNYYLVAFDDENGDIRHYRVDKLKDIEPVEKSARKGIEEFRSFDIGEYASKSFGMFAGDPETITLVIRKEKIGILYDRFGRDINTRPLSDGRISARVPVLVSQQFFGWLSGIGPDIEITMPKDIRERYRDYLKSILEGYSDKGD
ncbi:MAG: WYL domain-containing protein, partial [Lachnospiraceae bacterium]|nr:WYL domain-containing protein [Lachnospiraceae bacterium]